jgi:hypothetical protein
MSMVTILEGYVGEDVSKGDVAFVIANGGKGATPGELREGCKPSYGVCREGVELKEGVCLQEGKLEKLGELERALKKLGELPPVWGSSQVHGVQGLQGD